MVVFINTIIHITLRRLTMQPRIKLNWNTDNTEILSGYKIYRNDRPTIIGELTAPIETVRKTTFEYTDYNVVEGNAYYYCVSAYTPNDEAFSYEVSAVAKVEYDNIIILSGDTLLVHDIQSGIKAYDETMPSSFTSDDHVRHFSDGTYMFTNGNTVYIKDKYHEDVGSKTFPHKTTSLSYDDNHIYVATKTTVYILDYGLNIVYDINYGLHKYELRAVETNTESEYYAHGRASSSAYGWYIRRKSDNGVVSQYSPGASTIREIDFHGNNMYAYHTGSGREVTVINLNTLSKTTHYANSSQPQYTRTVKVAVNGNDVLFASTTTPNRIEILDMPFNRRKVVEDTLVFSNTIDSYNNRVYYLYNNNVIKSCDLNGDDIITHDEFGITDQIHSFSIFKVV